MRRRTFALAAVGVLAAAAATGGVLWSGYQPATPSAQESLANTATVERGKLSAMVAQTGTLTYRARSDGSPYSVINQADGVYTNLPRIGDKVECGDVLYRVDDQPVVLLCGAIPAYRELRQGVEGRDVRQLNRNLHALGYDRDAHIRIDPNEDTFTVGTKKALRVLQHDNGTPETGAIGVGDIVFLSESLRISTIKSSIGQSAQPGEQLLNATSNELQVQVNLDPSQQGEVRKGDRAQVTLPGNTTASGHVRGFGRVAQAPSGQDTTPTDATAEATIATYISLDDPAKTRGLDQAPVQVDITTKGVDSALSVPVTALVGKSGGGFAVEVVRPGERRGLIAVTVGLFDTGGGRVQVEGDLREGDAVVVPSP